MIEIPLEVYTMEEMRASTHQFLDTVDECGRVFLIRHSRGTDRSMLYKIIAMGPTKVPIKKNGVRPTLPDRESEAKSPIWEKL